MITNTCLSACPVTQTKALWLEEMLWLHGSIAKTEKATRKIIIWKRNRNARATEAPAQIRAWRITPTRFACSMRRLWTIIRSLLINDPCAQQMLMINQSSRTEVKRVNDHFLKTSIRLHNRFFAVLWAVGPLNQRSEVSYHSQFLKKDKFIDFSRQPFWNCPIPESEVLKPDLSLETQPRPQKLNQKKPQQDPSPRPIPTPKPVPKRDSWDIPPIQCNGEFKSNVIKFYTNKLHLQSLTMEFSTLKSARLGEREVTLRLPVNRVEVFNLKES